MRTLHATMAGMVVLLGSVAVSAQSTTGSLQGVWQTVEISIGGATPRTITIAEPRPYLTIITAKHYSRTEVQSDGPRQAIADVAKATADELRTVWGPFVGEAGTYEVSGDTITMHPLASKNPAAMAPGAFILYTYKLERNALWLIQQRNQNGPYPSPATFKLIRLE